MSVRSTKRVIAAHVVMNLACVQACITVLKVTEIFQDYLRSANRSNQSTEDLPSESHGKGLRLGLRLKPAWGKGTETYGRQVFETNGLFCAVKCALDQVYSVL
jgi:hypothetical protein